MSYTREQIEGVCAVLNIYATANAAKKEGNQEGDALAIIRQLLAENDALREDKERLNAIQEHCVDVQCVTQGEDSYGWVIFEHHMAEPRMREIGRSYREDGLREAIDAARKKD